MTVLARLFALSIALLSSACITPELIESAGKPTLRLSQRLRELGTESVAVDVVPGERLRGIFVPAAPGSPIVVHFMGSGTSVTTGAEISGMTLDIDELFADLKRAGFSSLALDYRGVGASDGTRASKHLRDDAQAVWREALARVEQDPDRVILRGTSIGTLAVASLLEAGARPSAVVLIAPVRAETIARNWLRANEGAFASAIVTPFLRVPTTIDMCAALASRPAPRVLAYGSEGDGLTSSEDRVRLRAALDSSGGCWIETCISEAGVERAADHFDIVLASLRLLPNELAPSIPPRILLLGRG